MNIAVCKGCGQEMPAVDKDGYPACITCHGLSEDNSIPVQKEISGRFECAYKCGSFAEVIGDKFQVFTSSKGGWNATYGSNSNLVSNLPFLDTENRKFYCGCHGWD